MEVEAYSHLSSRPGLGIEVFSRILIGHSMEVQTFSRPFIRPNLKIEAL
jgi:hypothetical protein